MSEENSQFDFDDSASEGKISYMDMFAGVIVSPAETFEKKAKTPSKVGDWLVPTLIFIIATVIFTVATFSDSALSADMKQKQLESVEKSLQKQVEAGMLTQDQKDKALEKAYEQLDAKGGFMFYGAIAGGVISSFLILFIVSIVFYVVAKFILKGEGTYNDVLVAYANAKYIAAIELLTVLIVSLLVGKIVALNAAFLFGADKSTFLGFVLSEIDPFGIWFFAVLGVALAKMFKSENTKAYVAWSLGVWIFFDLSLFLLSKAFPMFGTFNL